MRKQGRSKSVTTEALTTDTASNGPLFDALPTKALARTSAVPVNSDLPGSLGSVNCPIDPHPRRAGCAGGRTETHTGRQTARAAHKSAPSGYVRVEMSSNLPSRATAR